MPRQARLDAPGTLHHVIIRGIEQRKIVDKAMRRLGVREKSDERILGSGEFVEQLIEQSDKTRKGQFSSREVIQQAALLVQKTCKKDKVSQEALRTGSRRQKVSKLRSQLAEKLVEECGLPLTETGRQLGVSPSAVAKILKRRQGQKSSQ